jgi:hypothetical protein
MNKIFSVLGFFTVALLFLAVGPSCSNETISLGREFTLPAGKTASVSGEDLSLEFVAVTADSRCPAGVQCVWAGEAKCRLSVVYRGSVYDMTLTQPGGSSGVEELFQVYKVNFKLEPYPEYGKQIAPSDYRLVMTVTK